MAIQEVIDQAVVGIEEHSEIQVQYEGDPIWRRSGSTFVTTAEAKARFYELMAQGKLETNRDGSLAKHRIMRQMTVQMIELELVK